VGAVAAPLLRDEVTVSGPVVTLGDLFDDVGALAQTPLFRAPRPGTSGTVTLAEIRMAAAGAGLTEFQHSGVEIVSVSRSGSVVDADYLKALISDELIERGILTDLMHAETDFSAEFHPYDVPPSDTPASLDVFRYMPGSGTFSARFLIAGETRPLILGGRIDLYISVPHLKRSTQAGTILSPDDLEMRDVPLRYAESQGIAAFEDLIGKQLRRAGYEGLALKPGDVVEPDVVRRNSEVMVYYHSGPLTITVKGQALNDATAGEQVAVLNSITREIINGIATPGGAVEITSAPLTFANL